MTERSKERTYTDDEVQQRLKQDLPHWYLENGWIRRKYKTNSWKGTLMVINTVGHLAEAAWHHPDITASYAWVEVRLQNHAAKGITVDRRKIDIGGGIKTIGDHRVNVYLHPDVTAEVMVTVLPAE